MKTRRLFLVGIFIFLLLSIGNLLYFNNLSIEYSKISPVLIVKSIEERNKNEIFENWMKQKFFNSTLTLLEKEKLLKTFEECLNFIQEKARLQHLLFYGSLLGWFRHNHSMIPWDDDLDLAVFIPVEDNSYNDTDYKNIGKSALNRTIEIIENVTNSSSSSKLNFYYQRNFVKCYLNDSTISQPILDWRWPFIDIFPFGYLKDRNTAKIYDMEDEIYYNYQWIFPFQKSIFEGINVNIPQSPYQVLEANFNIETCTSSDWNHRLEVSSFRKNGQLLTPCRNLKSLYNFTNID